MKEFKLNTDNPLFKTVQAGSALTGLISIGLLFAGILEPAAPSPCDKPATQVYRQCVLAGGTTCSEVQDVVKDICEEDITNGLPILQEVRPTNETP